ncbi:MAG TPA: DNA helicase II [Planctomycetaceae bacterium]|nr:DNA helicase II [Planctomycetaceae bacterium]
MPHVPTQADKEVLECLRQRQSFSMVAGAGSGKTTSLVDALKGLLTIEGPRMLRDGQKAVCITYTNRAAEVICYRLRQNPLCVVSTLHSFLWGEVRHFPKSIREALRLSVLPKRIARHKEDDNGGTSKKAMEARAKAAELEQALASLDSVQDFRYGDDTPFSNYPHGEIGHDDLISVTSYMIQTRQPLRRVLGQKYPYIFVDEAQDTSADIVAAFNAMCTGEGAPVVGYFGDPMQQIYDKGLGNFAGPPNSKVITKEENFRSAPEIISLLNAFRKDVTQVAAGCNSHKEGSVHITLVQAEKPQGQRGRYTEVQLQRTQLRLAEAIELWGWTKKRNAKQLFLVWRMIARRLGFLPLHDLFTGQFASTRATNAYEEGEHFLIKPFLETIIPLVKAHRNHDAGAVMRVLTTRTAAFRSGGAHSKKSIRQVKGIANEVAETLTHLFASANLGDVLRYCREKELIPTSERLNNHLDRTPREEQYDEDTHVEDKADWLADAFFTLRGTEVENYCNFLDENTSYSTQHGVKGEEYDDVIVVFDDTEAAWNNYSFAKMLTPQAAGEPRDSQRARSQKLAYVCFSRAVVNLRVVLFTSDPSAAKRELVAQGLLAESQISVLSDEEE